MDAGDDDDDDDAGDDNDDKEVDIDICRCLSLHVFGLMGELKPFFGYGVVIKDSQSSIHQKISHS